MVELVGGGSDINRATLSSFSVSVLLLASVERFGSPVCGIFAYLLHILDIKSAKRLYFGHILCIFWSVVRVYLA